MTKKTFEQALAQLETLVQEIETGDLPLDRAMKKYEEGVRLARFCHDRLDETEAQIRALEQEGRGDFPGGEEGEADGD